MPLPGSPARTEAHSSRTCDLCPPATKKRAGGFEGLPGRSGYPCSEWSRALVPPPTSWRRARRAATRRRRDRSRLRSRRRTPIRWSARAARTRVRDRETSGRSRRVGRSLRMRRSVPASAPRQRPPFRRRRSRHAPRPCSRRAPFSRSAQPEEPRLPLLGLVGRLPDSSYRVAHPASTSRSRMGWTVPDPRSASSQILSAHAGSSAVDV